MKSIKLLILFQLFLLVSKAQDPYYSQYFMSPMTLNPALIGKGVADMRLLSNIRSQSWGTSQEAFKTTSVSFEKRIAEKKFTEDQLGIGISFVNDASNGGLLNKNFITIGAAFNKKISKYSSFGIGITANYANTLIDKSQLTLQNQFGSMGFDRSFQQGDPMMIANKSYYNTDAGIHYSYEDSTWGINFGSSIYHSAKNNQSLFDNSVLTLLPRYSTRLSVFKKYKSGDEFHLLTSIDIHGENNLFTLGSIYKLNIPGDHPINKLNIGLFDRFGYSIYPYVGFESTHWIAGITYDINNTNQKKYNYPLQSIEISIGWLLNNDKKRERIRSVIF